MVDCTGLENQRCESIREFESHSLRHGELNKAARVLDRYTEEVIGSTPIFSTNYLMVVYFNYEKEVHLHNSCTRGNECRM